MVLPNVEIECNFMPQLNSSPIVYNKMRLAFVTMPPEVYTIIPALLNTCPASKVPSIHLCRITSKLLKKGKNS